MKINESGRSMIEMLGVLAIIGVLSVGGIAGYSKAMNKYKVNSVADQMAMIVTNLRTLYAQQKDYNGLDTTAAIGMGVIPDDAIKTSGTGDSITKTAENPYGGQIVISDAPKKDSTDLGAFYVEYNGISRDACVNLSTSDWGTGANTGLMAVAAKSTAGAGAEMDGILVASGDGKADEGLAIGVIGKTTNGLPLSVASAAKACDCATDVCSFAVKYY